MPAFPQRPGASKLMVDVLHAAVRILASCHRPFSFLFVFSFSLIVAWIIGKATEHTGQHRHYQANTVRNRVVLSTIFLGLKVIDDPRVSLRLADVIAAIHSFHGPKLSCPARRERERRGDRKNHKPDQRPFGY